MGTNLMCECVDKNVGQIVGEQCNIEKKKTKNTQPIATNLNTLERCIHEYIVRISNSNVQ